MKAIISIFVSTVKYRFTKIVRKYGNILFLIGGSLVVISMLPFVIFGIGNIDEYMSEIPFSLQMIMSVTMLTGFSLIFLIDHLAPLSFGKGIAAIYLFAQQDILDYEDLVIKYKKYIDKLDVSVLDAEKFLTLKETEKLLDEERCRKSKLDFIQELTKKSIRRCTNLSQATFLHNRRVRYFNEIFDELITLRSKTDKKLKELLGYIKRNKLMVSEN